MQDSLDLASESPAEKSDRELLGELVADYASKNGGLYIAPGAMTLEEQARRTILDQSFKLQAIDQALRIFTKQEGVELPDGEPSEQIKELVRQLVSAAVNYHWIEEWTAINYKAIALIADTALLFDEESDKDTQLRGLSLLLDKQVKILDDKKKRLCSDTSYRIYAHQLRANDF